MHQTPGKKVPKHLQIKNKRQNSPSSPKTDKILKQICPTNEKNKFQHTFSISGILNTRANTRTKPFRAEECYDFLMSMKASSMTCVCCWGPFLQIALLCTLGWLQVLQILRVLSITSSAPLILLEPLGLPR